MIKGDEAALYNLDLTVLLWILVAVATGNQN